MSPAPNQRPNPDRTRVDRGIDQLLELGRTTNPLELLSAAAFRHLAKRQTETGVVEDSHASEAQVEFLLSLLTARPFPAGAARRTPAVAEECLALLESTYQGASVCYSLTSRSRANNPAEEELIASLRLDTLHVRGEGYRHHLDWFYREIAGPHDAMLRSAVDFDSGQFADAITHISATIQANLDLANQRRLDARNAYYGLAARELGQPLESNAVRELASSPKFSARHTAELAAAMAAFNELDAPNIFAVTPRHAVEELVFRRIALNFGDNAAFLDDIPRWRGWPLNPSRIHERPLVAHAGQYYAFHLPLLGRGALSIIEEILRTVNAGYWQNSFLRRRDDWVESTAVDLIARMLPGCTPYKNLFYDCVVDGQPVHTEVDGLIAFDDCLIIIEVKASALGDDARRGAPDAIAEALRDSLDKAYAQAQRLLTLIRSSEEVRFTNERGDEQLRLRFREFRQHFLISVTRESMGHAATRLQLTRRLGFIQGGEWPWAVSLLDLRIISELVGRPSMFLHYLTRRIAANDDPALAAQDEIDLFGYFLAGQLFFDPTERRAATMVIPVGFDEEINRYFEAQARGDPLPAKPTMQLPPIFDAFLAMLERARPCHYTTACLQLLSYNGVLYGQVDACVPSIEEAYRVRRVCRQGTVGNRDNPSFPLIILACCQLDSMQETQAKMMIATNKRRRSPRHQATVILWEPPLSGNRCRITLLPPEPQ